MRILLNVQYDIVRTASFGKNPEFRMNDFYFYFLLRSIKYHNIYLPLLACETIYLPLLALGRTIVNSAGRRHYRGFLCSSCSSITLKQQQQLYVSIHVREQASTSRCILL